MLNHLKRQAPTFGETVNNLTKLDVKKVDSAKFLSMVTEARELLPELTAEEQQEIIGHIFRLQIEIITHTNSFIKLDEYLNNLVIYLASNDQSIVYNQFELIVRATKQIYLNTCGLVLESSEEEQAGEKMQSVIRKVHKLWTDEKFLLATDKLIIMMEKQSTSRFTLIDSNGIDIFGFIKDEI